MSVDGCTSLHLVAANTTPSSTHVAVMQVFITFLSLFLHNIQLVSLSLSLSIYIYVAIHIHIYASSDE